MKPATGFTGNHVVATDGTTAFDFHGYCAWDRLLAHARRKNAHRMPGWNCTLVALPPDVLMSEAKSKAYEGLWLRGPEQYLHDALPRARTYVRRFAVPAHIGVGELRAPAGAASGVAGAAVRRID